MLISGIKPTAVATLICMAAVVISAVPVQAQAPAEVPVQREAPSASEPIEFNIPAQPLPAALSEFARQSGRQLLYSPEIASDKIAPEIQGSMTPLEALDQILAGTGLIRTLTPSGAILINSYSAGGSNSPKGDGSVGSDGAISNIEVAAGSGAAVAPAGVQGSRGDGIEEIIITGQKKEERLQDVPIAISAFSMDQLDNQKIEGGFDLLKAIPNVTFSKTNFTGYNFQIRGIGTQAISATTDPGVAMSMNNTTLIVNRLFEQEYLDMERVEVLRGPQGTLFGRNATAGVINVITAKPQMGIWAGEVKLEAGNYGSERMRGHVNIPLLGDTLAARIAYASTKREGYGTNLAEGGTFVGREAPSSTKLDDRDLWTGRISLGWRPTDRVRANLIYERFEEDDHRLRTAKQLCHRDPGDNVGGILLHDMRSITSVDFRNLSSQLSQGCLPGSLFDKGDPDDPLNNGAYGIPMGDTIPFIRGVRSQSGTVDLVSPDRAITDPLSGGGAQSQGLRTIFSPITPEYRAKSDLVEISADIELADGLTVSSQTVYMENDLFSTQDFLRFETLSGMFIDSPTLIMLPQLSHVEPWLRSLTPGGVFYDPQLGPSDRILIQDVSQQSTSQLSQEIRLSSSLEGPLNFSVGVNYTRFENTSDYFVFSNAISLLAQSALTAFIGLPSELANGELALMPGFVGDGASGMSIGCGTRFDHDTIVRDAFGQALVASCVYVQPESLGETIANPEGHNFFLSRNPYKLNSASLFGEIYYDLADTLKLTAGLRLNWDRKTFTPVPSQTLLPDWRGRFEGGFLSSGTNPPTLGNVPNSIRHCDRRLNPSLSGIHRLFCSSAGTGENGRGYPEMPDIVQEWRVPTGRIGLDWKPDFDLTWLDETLLYAFYTRGYKAGGANPPGVSAPQGILMAVAQGAEALPTFEAEYVNAIELGTKNKLFGGLVTLSASAFYYDYTDYQVSKIVDRSAANENFDATIWGLELESLFAVTPDTLLNANIGYLRTRLADDQRSLDLMDRTQGGGADYWIDRDGNRHELQWGEWVVIKPNILQASNCVAPAELVRDMVINSPAIGFEHLAAFCPGGMLVATARPPGFDPFTDTPNGGAGFFAEIGGNELPNAPRFTVSLGAQHTMWLGNTGWSATGRVDWYWQDESYHRVYNTEYDRLQDWTNTNLSFWVSNDRLGLTLEAYVKNAFNETPVTGAFLNSDDTGLSTNVFTLDPRLVGVSIRKRF